MKDKSRMSPSHWNELDNLVVVHAQGVLDLVATVTDRLAHLHGSDMEKQNLHGGSGTAVSLVVRGALGLVKSRLGSRLLVIGLDAADNAVSSVAEGLADLLLGRLGGVRSKLLLGLCGLLAADHKRETGEGMAGKHILVVKSLRPKSDMVIDLID